MKNFIFLLIIMAVTLSSNAQVVFPGFEYQGQVWTVTSTNFGTPLCTVDICGNGGGESVPFAGDWFAWFGGANAIETASVEQDIEIPSGISAELSFWISIPTPGPGLIDDKLVLSLDGNDLIVITALDSSAYDNYTQVSIDISTYADGGNHLLQVEGFQSTDEVFSILLDLFTMTVDSIDIVEVNEILNRKNVLSVYPNPAIEELNIQFNHEISGNAEVTVIALNGEVVSTDVLSEITNKTYTLNTSEMEAGMYVVQVTSGNQTMTQRFVVSK